jgi:hypothetical protein
LLGPGSDESARCQGDHKTTHPKNEKERPASPGSASALFSSGHAAAPFNCATTQCIAHQTERVVCTGLMKTHPV